MWYNHARISMPRGTRGTLVDKPHTTPSFVPLGGSHPAAVKRDAKKLEKASVPLSAPFGRRIAV
jgi:hypothetical protein